MLTKNMLIKKDVWDIVSVKPCPLQRPNMGWNRENKEDQMAIKMA